jgi:hypothetical protein
VAEEPFALTLLHLAHDHQFVAVQVDVDVFASHPRKLDFDGVRAVSFDDIGRWQPGTLTGLAAKHRLRQTIHLHMKIIEIVKRASLRLTGRSFHGQSHVSSSSHSSVVVSPTVPSKAARHLALSGRFPTGDFTREVSRDGLAPGMHMMKRGLSGPVRVVVSNRGEHFFVFTALDSRVAVLGQMEKPLGAGFQWLEDRLEPDTPVKATKGVAGRIKSMFVGCAP